MKALAFVIAFFAAFGGKATIQRSELCAIGDDTLRIDMYENWDIVYGPFRKGLSEKVNPKHLTSGCLRGYISTWAIEDSCFYLKSIKIDVGNKNLAKTFESISGRSFTKKGMLADWITGTVYAGIEMRFPWVHSYEIALHLEKGKLVRMEEFGTKEPPVGLSYALQDGFLYKGIDENVLKQRTEPDLFFAVLHVSKEGILDSVSFNYFDSTSTLHWQFLERIKNLNYWGQCFYLGKAIPYRRNILTNTDKKTRKHRIRLLR